MQKITQPINETLPIEEYAKLHFPCLFKNIKAHASNYLEDEETLELSRHIFILFREHMNEFDTRPSTVPNIGINDDKMCANRYRKISRQVCEMGGWANFEHYVHNSFVNEAHEFNKLAMFVESITKMAPQNETMILLTKKAKEIIKGLK